MSDPSSSVRDTRESICRAEDDGKRIGTGYDAWRVRQEVSGMTDYWLSKLFYDLQQPAVAAAYRADRAAVIARYPMKPEAVDAAMADDVGALARLVNPYLLRYYFTIIGTRDDVFIERLRQSAAGTPS
ncbi:MAG TPA: hypothetical protein VL993_13210 [Stellaceae bacterium]|nr:hypothetical protein [Stellaceae bacterium]